MGEKISRASLPRVSLDSTVCEPLLTGIARVVRELLNSSARPLAACEVLGVSCQPAAIYL